jgi:anti-sigma B factor antagonist
VNRLAVQTRTTPAGIAPAAVPAHLSGILHMVGLGQVFPTHPTAQAAEAGWTPPASRP